MTARVLLGLTSLSLSLACAPALATATYCSAGLSPDGLSVSNLTFRGAGADDCFGVQAGNDSGANGAFIGWNGFEQLLSDQSGDATGASRNWMGIDWSLSGAASARNGNFALAWSGANLPDLALDLVFVEKASDRFASYLFSDALFDTSAGSSAGTWNITYKNNGGAVPKLSHLSVWARVAPVLTVAVAEPGSLGLLVLGVCGIVVACVWRAPSRLIRREGAP